VGTVFQTDVEVIPSPERLLPLKIKEKFSRLVEGEEQFSQLVFFLKVPTTTHYHLRTKGVGDGVAPG